MRTLKLAGAVVAMFGAALVFVPPIAAAAGVSPEQFMDLEKRGLQKPPKAITSKSGPTGLLMDIRADDFCREGGPLTAFQQFIDDRQVTIAGEEKRAVALTLNVAFAEAKDSAPAKIPLAFIPPKGAKDQQGNDIKPVLNCQGVVLGGLSSHQPLVISFELSYSQNDFQITPLAQTALAFLGSALTTASILGPHTATAGSGILAFSAGLAEVTKQANAFLALFKKSEDASAATFRWETNTTALVFSAYKRISLSKSFRNTMLNFDAGDVLTWPDAFHKLFGDAGTLSATFNNNKVVAKWQAFLDNGTSSNFRAFCETLQDQAGSAYGSDQVAVAASIYYFQAALHKESLAPQKLTCLSDIQVEALSRVGIKKSPYDGALDPKAGSPADGGGDANSVSNAEFERAKYLMDGLAVALKNAPAAPGELQVFKTRLLKAFPRDVIATAYGTDLLPNSERGVDSAVLIDYLVKWNDISHFGCYGKPASPNLRKATAEGLMLFAKRKLLALVQFTKEPKQDMFTAIDVVKAREEDVKRLLGDRKTCGWLDDWDPLADFKKLNSEVVSQGPIDHAVLMARARWSQ